MFIHLTFFADYQREIFKYCLDTKMRFFTFAVRFKEYGFYLLILISKHVWFNW
jgi:hypothetical protein